MEATSSESWCPIPASCSVHAGRMRENERRLLLGPYRCIALTKPMRDESGATGVWNLAVQKYGGHHSSRTWRWRCRACTFCANEQAMKTTLRGEVPVGGGVGDGTRNAPCASSATLPDNAPARWSDSLNTRNKHQQMTRFKTLQTHLLEQDCSNHRTICCKKD